MKDKEFKKQLIGFGIAVFILVVLGLLSGIYNGSKELLNTLSIGKDTIFKLLMEIVFVVCFSKFVLIILKLFQSKTGRV